MLPAPPFKLSTREVPVFNNSRPAKGQEAELAIGEYALIGKFFKKSAWKSVEGFQQFGF
jgi:hypothetical protein